MTPHVIVLQNLVSPLQRNFQQITDVIKDVNAILAPPISELSIARAGKQSFTCLNGIKGTRFHTEIERAKCNPLSSPASRPRNQELRVKN
ncbi:MAG: hypothetical protein EBU63_08735 [Alphaproteobacteria bacterium]|nr:hypothetical protein [Alphaproteobacteria bacterium]